MVAGVPTLADYDVIIDAGGDASDPENAVPFSIKTEDGKTFKQPGNLFFLVESALYGTEPKWSTAADVDGDGKVAFGEALPEPRFYLAAADRVRHARRRSSTRRARQWSPTEQDALTALVVMTPTMSEYFEAWKNSRFVAGDKATEKSFVGASRLQDIADILGGLELIYANVQPKIAEAERRAGRPDRPVAERARGVRGAPARPGGGRQEVHGRGRRHARPPRRRSQRRGDRRPDHPGRQAARDRARELGVRLALGHRSASPRRSPPRLPAPRRRAEHAVAGRGARAATRSSPRRSELILGTPRAAGATSPRRARRTAARCGARCGRTRRPPTARCGARSASPRRAARRGDRRALAAARGEVRAALFARRLRGHARPRRPRRRRAARRWLLLRDFRTATRFSRPGADATAALGRLATGRPPRARRGSRSPRTCSTPTRRASASCSRTPTPPREKGFAAAGPRPPPRPPG